MQKERCARNTAYYTCLHLSLVSVFISHLVRMMETHPFSSLRLWLQSHRVAGDSRCTSEPVRWQHLAQTVCPHRDLLECMASLCPLSLTHTGSYGEILSSPLQPPEFWWLHHLHCTQAHTQCLLPLWHAEAQTFLRDDKAQARPAAQPAAISQRLLLGCRGPDPAQLPKTYQGLVTSLLLLY